MPVLETVQREVEAIEDRRVRDAASDRVEVQRLYMLRRDLLRLRNAAAPARRGLPPAGACRGDADRPRRCSRCFATSPTTSTALRRRSTSLREVLAFAFEASLMVGQAQQTAITRRLAAWAAILAVPTAIAGIYGMNFEHMPELKWQYGYFLVLGIIAAICGTMFWRLRRNGWL